MMEIEQIDSETTWNMAVQTLGGHPLQLWGWGSVKAGHGWKVCRLLVKSDDRVVAGAQVLVKTLPKPFRPYAYIPRGPFGDSSDEAMHALTSYLKRSLKPLVVAAEPDTIGQKPWNGWRESRNYILLSRTARLDLTRSEDELLAAMSKKTRQYIRKSANEGVSVELAQSIAEINDCLAIYKATAVRAGFALHDDQYYHDIYRSLGDASPVYMARREGEVVAFLWPVISRSTAFELYGGMNERGQHLRANYHLKWHVIRALKEQGIEHYDVNGLLNDGVTAFKKGFIPVETMMSGTFDCPVDTLQYAIWSKALPSVKRMMQMARKLTSR